MAARSRKKGLTAFQKRNKKHLQSLTLQWQNNYVFNMQIAGERGKLLTRAYQWQYAKLIDVFIGLDAWNILIDILEADQYMNPSVMMIMPGWNTVHKNSVSEKMRGMILDVVHSLHTYQTLWGFTDQDAVAFDDLRHYAALALVRLHQHDRAIAERKEPEHGTVIR